MLEPYYVDDMVTLLHGDALEMARTVPTGSVQTIVTSPPYFGLRDYGEVGQMGAEDTLAGYVAGMVALFSELRRTLADDGTLWLNLGDSYATKQRSTDSGNDMSKSMGAHRLRELGDLPRGASDGIAEKNLLGVPWRTALALQSDGWILRSDIIWAKPNPMPESVTDRPTKSHEYLFLLAKSPRYYYNAEAIAETVTDSTLARVGQNVEAQTGSTRAAGGTGKTNGNMKAIGPQIGNGTRNRRTVWAVPTMPFSGAHFAVYPPELIRPCILAGSRPAGRRCDCDEVIATPTGTGTGWPDPTSQVGRAGMARPRGDGEGVRPITRREQRDYARQMQVSAHRNEMQEISGSAFAHYIRTDRNGARPLPKLMLADFVTRGWLVDPAPCEHPVKKADTVLDPFSGSGTTGMVANQEGRKYIGIDLNSDYLNLSLKTRFAQPALNMGEIA